MTEPSEKPKRGRPKDKIYDLRYRDGHAMQEMRGAIHEVNQEMAIGIGRAYCHARGLTFVCLVEQPRLGREILDMDPTEVQAKYQMAIVR